MYKKIALPLLLCFSIAAKTQSFRFDVSTDWAGQPGLHKQHKPFDSASAVCILDDRLLEYRSEGKEINAYYSLHKIIAINDDRGVEMYNKLYIPLSGDANLTRVRLRVIQPGGKVIPVDSAKMNRIEEDGKTYGIFAIEGLSKGSEFEFNYIIKYNLFLFGSETFQTGGIPCQEARFTLVTPSHLRFSAKGYNGMKVSKDSLIGEKRIIAGYDTEIPELPEEKYAYRTQYLRRIDYKLSYNLANGENIRLYTWKELARKVYARYTERTEKEDKALDGFIAQMKLPQEKDAITKMQLAEDFIKTSINIDKKLIGENAGQLESIIQTRSANQEGIYKLFSGVLSKIGVNFQMVFPGDRREIPLDEELEDWNRLDDIVFYFPSTGKYLAPMNVELRYPYIPYEFAGTKGLFLKGTTIGNFTTALGVFNDIKMEPYTENAHDMEADLSLNESLDTVIVKSTQLFRGYGAHGIRPVYTYLPKEKQDEFTKQMVKNLVNTDQVTEMKVTNTSLMDGGPANKPLLIYGVARSAELMENAGKKILLKIGDVIGPQVQMYQEKSRQMPVEIEYPHTLNRKITLHLPEGYEAENLKDLVFNVSYNMDAADGMGFISGYEQKGNDIIITIAETYKGYQYPLSQFISFQKVINASADFNKVVLVLRKK